MNIVNKPKILTALLWAMVVLLALAAVLEANRWWVLVALGALAIIGAFIFRHGLRRVLREVSTHGTDQVWIEARWMLPIAVGVGIWHFINHRNHLIQSVVIVVVLGALIWITKRIETSYGETAPYIANIPGLPHQRVDKPKVGYQAFSLVLLAGILGCAFLTLLPWGSTIVWISFAIVSVFLIVVAVLNLRYGANMRQFNKALADFGPVFALPHDGTALFHLEMWTPYFERAGLPFIQVATRLDTFQRRAATSSLPIVAPLNPTDAGLRATLPKTLKAAFYPRNGTLNIRFIELRPELTHVFLHHGDGDKPASSSGRSGQYDVLIVAGEAAIERYAMRNIQIPREKFKILGRPQVANIFEASSPISEIEVPTVSYAPTWRGKNKATNFSSLHVGPQIVRELLARNVRVIFRPHAAGQKHPPHAAAIAEIKHLLEEDHNATGRKHVWGKQAEETWSFADVANESDMMVADVSGVITDYMQSGKPFVMVSTKMGADQFRTQFPSSNSAYIIESTDLSTIPVALDDALGPDIRKAKRLERRSFYLGGYSGDGSPQAFVNYLFELAGREP